MSEPIGSLIEALGVTYDPDPGELPCAAVVLLKTVDDSGRVGLSLRFSEGMSWIERLGMLRAAERIELNDILPDD
jgi:hypothetical protein